MSSEKIWHKYKLRLEAEQTNHGITKRELADRDDEIKSLKRALRATKKCLEDENRRRINAVNTVLDMKRLLVESAQKLRTMANELSKDGTCND